MRPLENQALLPTSDRTGTDYACNRWTHICVVKFTADAAENVSVVQVPDDEVGAGIFGIQ
jgi:hypothetical protein